MSVEQDLLDHWAGHLVDFIDMTAFNFAMAFAEMDKDIITYPAVVDLSKTDFEKLFGIKSLRKHELAIRLEHPINIKTYIKDFIEWSRL